MVDIDTAGESVCSPMNGFMTAWVSEPDDGRRLSEADLYAVIEKYTMAYNTEGSVLAISYIGTRPDGISTAEAPFIDKAIKDDGQRDDLASGSTSMSPGAIAGITVGSLLALLAVLAMVAKKRKDKRNKERQEMSRNIVDEALFMSDDEDEAMKVVKDDVASVHTEDYTYVTETGTFASREEAEEHTDEAGFEVKL